ncbi:MurR/RpiR family transcriptional regulator [Dorea sp. D27]|uniref:MurR/RpiR family transcriptional regulator n=1 Tax=Dorea sp. D27 TaxID=658665 RepID=UPI0006739917|nr:MurR/RpiR family transcriptional regulator [Dorea sp. D27]KMZ54371.1 putative RpiR protein [Dorea sp. D27]
MQKISHKVQVELNAVYHALKSAEKKAADYVLLHPQQAACHSITESAKRAGCSEATLVRLAQKLGYGGYAQMKQALLPAEAVTELDMPLPYGDIGESRDASTVIRSVFGVAAQALEDTMQLLDNEAYEKCLAYIIHAGKVLIAGAGDAYTVAYSAYLKFSRVGIAAACPADFDVQLMEASGMGPDDVLLLISHSGETRTLCRVAEAAGKKGTHIITVTNYPLSTLARLSGCVIRTAAFTKNPCNETVAKRIPELCIIEALYISILQGPDEQYAKTLKCSNEQLKKNKF